jgi:hypothetical protein
MSDKVLTYLQGDSQGARRDLIAHCYYDAAQGDPKSGPVVFAVKQIADDFRTLKGDLKLHHESTKAIAEGVAEIKTIHQDNQDLVKHFLKQARFNWLTIGFLGGIIFDSLANEVPAPHWMALFAFAIGAGLLQWLFRHSWNFVKKKVDREK